jgi:hypothetical protein
MVISTPVFLRNNILLNEDHQYKRQKSMAERPNVILLKPVLIRLCYMLDLGLSKINKKPLLLQKVVYGRSCPEMFMVPILFDKITILSKMFSGFGCNHPTLSYSFFVLASHAFIVSWHYHRHMRIR